MQKSFQLCSEVAHRDRDMALDEVMKRIIGDQRCLVFVWNGFKSQDLHKLTLLEQKKLSLWSSHTLSDRIGYRSVAAGRVSKRRGSNTSSAQIVCASSIPCRSSEISVLFGVLLCLPEIASPLLEYSSPLTAQQRQQRHLHFFSSIWHFSLRKLLVEPVCMVLTTKRKTRPRSLRRCGFVQNYFCLPLFRNSALLQPHLSCEAVWN